MVDDRGAPASGTVSLIDRDTGATRHVEVGIHPTAIVVDGGRAFVANAMSDSVSEVDLKAGKVARTIPLRWGSLRVLGGMPNALALQRRDPRTWPTAATTPWPRSTSPRAASAASATPATSRRPSR